MKKLTLLLLMAIATIGYNQISTEYIEPIQTDSGYTAGQDPHMVVRNTDTQPEKLFLFLGGTRTPTWVYEVISEFAAGLGFDVINLAYSNSVGTVNFANSRDSLIFNDYHQEICYGEPASEAVRVDTLNSIYMRTVKLLQYLNEISPEELWHQYLIDSTSLDWSKIIIGGHSQGSGHACYLAKCDTVTRLFMLAGPNDYSNYFSNSANWLRTAGKTPVENHYAYLNLLDEIVSFDKQLANLEGLGLYPEHDTSYIDHLQLPYDNPHILTTTQDIGVVYKYHNAVIMNTEINRKVWTYMLTSEITTTNYLTNIIPLDIYPNPAIAAWNVRMGNGLYNEPYHILNILGQEVLKGRLSGADPYSIDCTALKGGIYFISIDNRTLKIIKQ